MSPTTKTAYAVTLTKSCERNCDFPSECRWRPKLKTQRKVGAAKQSKSGPTIPLLISPASAEENAEPGLTSAIIHDFAAFKAEMDTVVPSQPLPPRRSGSVTSSTSGPLPSVFDFDDDDDDDDDAMEVDQLDALPQVTEERPETVSALIPAPLVVGKGRGW